MLLNKSEIPFQRPPRFAFWKGVTHVARAVERPRVCGAGSLFVFTPAAHVVRLHPEQCSAGICPSTRCPNPNHPCLDWSGGGLILYSGGIVVRSPSYGCRALLQSVLE